MAVELPTDTIFEREPLEPIEPKAIEVFKLLLLEFGKIHRFNETMTPTEIINAMERCRREGLLKIYQNKRGEFSMQLTPTGSATVFLENLKR